jgi:hypothetical protein
LISFCATCRQAHAVVDLKKLIWLVDNFLHGDRRRKDVIESESNALLLSHVLVELCSRYGRIRSDFNLLIERGATFRIVPSGKLGNDIFEIMALGKSQKGQISPSTRGVFI